MDSEDEDNGENLTVDEILSSVLSFKGKLRGRIKYSRPAFKRNAVDIEPSGKETINANQNVLRPIQSALQHGSENKTDGGPSISKICTPSLRRKDFEVAEHGNYLSMSTSKMTRSVSTPEINTKFIPLSSSRLQNIRKIDFASFHSNNQQSMKATYDENQENFLLSKKVTFDENQENFLPHDKTSELYTRDSLNLHNNSIKNSEKVFYSVEGKNSEKVSKSHSITNLHRNNLGCTDKTNKILNDLCGTKEFLTKSYSNENSDSLNLKCTKEERQPNQNYKESTQLPGGAHLLLQTPSTHSISSSSISRKFQNNNAVTKRPNITTVQTPICELKLGFSKNQGEGYDPLSFKTPSAAKVSSVQKCREPPLPPSTPSVPSTPSPPSPSLKLVDSDLIVVKGLRYFKFGKLGKGGSSVVYEVMDFVSRQRKAIKQVSLENEDDSVLESYKNEIDILKRLQYSERVIKLYDYEVTPTKLFLVMEAGEIDLAKILSEARQKNARPIPPFTIKHYWQEMLLAVQVIHKEGIIHSDLKPANFLLVNGRLKLIDFGIASSIQQDMTSVFKDNQSGTFNYMSPESLSDISSGPITNGKAMDKPTVKIGVKSDVWSLGCILYNLVYGRTPFQHLVKTMQKLIAISDPRTSISFPAVADKNLLEVMQKCLQYNHRSRPSIGELLSHPYLEGGVTDANEQTKHQSTSSNKK